MKRERIIQLRDKYLKTIGTEANNLASEMLYKECQNQMPHAKTPEDFDFIGDHCPVGIGLKIVARKRAADMRKKINESNRKKICKANSIKSLLILLENNENNPNLRELTIERLEAICNDSNLIDEDFETLCALVSNCSDKVAFFESARSALMEKCRIEIQYAQIERLHILFKMYPFDDTIRSQIYIKARQNFHDEVANISSCIKLAEHVKLFFTQFIKSIEHIDKQWEYRKALDFDELYVSALKRISDIEKARLYQKLCSGIISPNANLQTELWISELKDGIANWLKNCTIDDILQRFNGKVRYKDIDAGIWDKYVDLCLEELSKLNKKQDIRQFAAKYNITTNSRIGKAIDRKMAEVKK